MTDDPEPLGELSSRDVAAFVFQDPVPVMAALSVEG